MSGWLLALVNTPLEAVQSAIKSVDSRNEDGKNNSGKVFFETFLCFWQPALAGVCACVREESGSYPRPNKGVRLARILSLASRMSTQLPGHRTVLKPHD